MSELVFRPLSKITPAGWLPRCPTFYDMGSVQYGNLFQTCTFGRENLRADFKKN